MAKATIRFQRIEINSAVVNGTGGATDHLISKIRFSAEVDGRLFDGCHVVINQAHGVPFTDPIEVARPTLCVPPYRGLWNHQAFADACEEYFRAALGGDGWAIRFDPAHTLNTSFMDLNMTRRHEVTFEVSSGGGGW